MERAGLIAGPTFLKVKGGINMETSWITLVTDVGFPVMVTFYLLHRIEGKMNVLIDSIRNLPEKMQPLRPA